jgi:predicted small lipoprotein YifL
MNKRIRCFTFTIAVLFISTLAGCGQTGPLFLPGAESAPDPVSADDDDDQGEDEDEQ